MAPDPYQTSAAGRALQAAGLRVTATRVAVLSELRRIPHATADQVETEVRARLGAVSTQAVYDVLAALERVELVRRIEPAGHAARFETRVLDNHHHVVCRGCGRVQDVDCAVGPAPCLEPSAAPGFEVDEAEVTFWGLCASCLGYGRVSGPGSARSTLSAARHDTSADPAREPEDTA
jgi:Fur family transcriptional regulator, stress-responsive regulator